jgi:hypothetical protein
MIYVAWATMFFTLAFDRKSKLDSGLGNFCRIDDPDDRALELDGSVDCQLATGTQFVLAHDPRGGYRSELRPVYAGDGVGRGGLAANVVHQRGQQKKMELNIKEITYINEMALTIGLVMLTIGNFLGGQWANESWGRYWGWDPKETWALISIMIYAFVIHARFVPALGANGFTI